MPMVLSSPALSEIAWAKPRSLARFHEEGEHDRAGEPARSCPAGERGVAPAFPYLPPAAAAVAALEARGCRWPLGEPADRDFAFCGAVRLSRGSYCAVHARIARPGPAGRGAAA